MGKHLHKRFTEKEVQDILERYLSGEVGVKQGMALLKIGRRRFFDLLKVYRELPEKFSLEYKRKSPSRRLDEKVETKIIHELKKEEALIQDKNNPIRDYNYSYVREILERKHKMKVSLPTIIRRAKKKGFIKKRNAERLTTERS